MKKLELKRMEDIQGGKLTQEEIDTFLGVAGCVGAIIAASFLGALACANWISKQ